MNALATYPIVKPHSAQFERVEFGPNRSDYYLRPTQVAQDRELDRQFASVQRRVAGAEASSPLNPMSSRFD